MLTADLFNDGAIENLPLKDPGASNNFVSKVS